MFEFTVTWYDPSDEVTIIKRVTLDESMVEDIATEGISNYRLKEILVGMEAEVENID